MNTTAYTPSLLEVGQKVRYLPYTEEEPRTSYISSLSRLYGELGCGWSFDIETGVTGLYQKGYFHKLGIITEVEQ